MNDEVSIFETDDLPPEQVSKWYRVVAVTRGFLALYFVFKFLNAIVEIIGNFKSFVAMELVGQLIGFLILGYLLSHYTFYAFFQMKAEWNSNISIFYQRKSRWSSLLFCGFAVASSIYFSTLYIYTELNLSIESVGFLILSFVILFFDIYYLRKSKV